MKAMNRKRLFSSAGLVAVAVALLLSVTLINLLPGWRVDLTEDRLFSLAEGTRNIVTGLEQPIELLFFFSDEATEDTPQIRSYANRVRELLEETVIASGGNLSLTMVDPEPFSEDEDRATRYGVRPVPMTQGGEEVYFGLVARRAGADADPANPLAEPVWETIPLIRPDLEEFLEYEFMKLITTVANPDRQVVGLLTGLDMDGGFDPMRGQPTPPWIIMDLIRQLYEVRRMEESVDEDVDILMIVHPTDLSPQMLYAIDQHVMRGGRTLLFLDPSADSMVSRSLQGTLVPAGMRSGLPGLLEAWGIDFDNSKVLADNALALRVMMNQGQRPTPHLSMLGLTADNMTPGDVITNRLESINLSSGGALGPVEGATTTFEPLLVSSTEASLLDASLVENLIDPSALFDEFVASGESYVIAARVSGVIDSAFPEGRPEEEEEEEEGDEEAANEEEADGAESDTEATPDEAANAVAGSDDDADEDAPVDAATAEPEAETEAEQALAEHLGSSGEPVNIVVFSDSDLLSDRLWVQVSQFFGQRIPQPFANNGDVVINALDNLAGGADLATIRSRGRYSRPFTRVMDLQREADDRLRNEEGELQDRLAETEASLAQLSQNEEGEPLDQVTPEIQAEIDRFNAELLDTRRRLREVQFQLTEDIERLGAVLKLINSALIPVLLTGLVLLTHYRRGQRRKTPA